MTKVFMKEPDVSFPYTLSDESSDIWLKASIRVNTPCHYL